VGKGRIAVAGAVAAAVLLAPAGAWARFVANDTAALDVRSDALAAPTSVTLAKKCGWLLSPAGTLTATWSASADTYATGYVATLTTGAGATTTQTLAGRSATQASFPITITTSYTVTVTTTYRNWTSPTVTSTAVSCSVLGG
jgi:hypothetical protein